MMKMHDWVREAQEASGLSGAALSRRLYQKLGRDTEDRSIIGKMSKPPGSAGAKSRRTTLEEALALAEITGHPLPDNLRTELRIGDAVGAIEVQAQPKKPDIAVEPRQGPLQADEVAEPIEGERAIESALRRIVGLTDKDVAQAMRLVLSAISRNIARRKPSPHRGQSQRANRHRA